MLHGKPEKTLKEIAEQANVSQSLVSLILNGKGRASEKVRQRVLTMLEESGYRPKYARRPFYFVVDLPGIEAAGKTQNVLEQLSGMQRVFNTLELELRIEFLDTKNGAHTIGLSEQLDAIVRQKPSGVLISTDATFLDDACSRFHKSNIPVVQVGYDTENPAYNAVVSDSFISVYLATSHLIQKGHKRIAILRWLAGMAGMNSNKKLAGYQAALSDRNIEVRPDYIVSLRVTQNEPGWQPARNLVNPLFELPDPPSALVVENSFIGLSLLYPLASDKGSLPPIFNKVEIIQCEDWALQPVHDIVSEKLFYPEMNTTLVCIDWEAIGKAAAEMIIDKASGGSSVPRIIRISPSLYRVQKGKRELLK